MPRARIPFPWILAPIAIGLVTVAFRSSTNEPPEHASAGRLQWSSLNAAPTQKRGPFGVGVHLHDVVIRDGLILAVAPKRQFSSADDGATWKERTDVDGAQRLAIDGDVILAAGSENGLLRRSADRGRTWSKVEHKAIRGQRGIPLSVGLALSDSIAMLAGPEMLLRSTDSGKTWASVPGRRLTLQNVAMRGQVVLVVGSGGHVRRSMDGGATWTEHWIGTYDLPMDVAFADDTTAVLVGTRGTIFRTTDAGATWSRVGAPTRTMLRSVAFADARTGMAVGFWGEALLTTDGGATWSREMTGTNAHLLGVAAHPAGGFVVTGLRETILRARP